MTTISRCHPVPLSAASVRMLRAKRKIYGAIGTKLVIVGILGSLQAGSRLYCDSPAAGQEMTKMLICTGRSVHLVPPPGVVTRPFWYQPRKLRSPMKPVLFAAQTLVLGEAEEPKAQNGI
ncbi:MAG: hypothetical protein ACREQV_00520 [Candidatus Binatia bacterium]